MPQFPIANAILAGSVTLLACATSKSNEDHSYQSASAQNSPISPRSKNGLCRSFWTQLPQTPEELVAMVGRRDLGPIQSLLDSFDPKTIQSEAALIELSRNGVYKVLLHKGSTPRQNIWGVLRLVASRENALYEKWVSEMVHSAPAGVISPVRIMKPTCELHRLIHLKLAAHNRLSLAVHTLKNNPSRPYWLTLGVFFPGQMGSSFLNAHFAQTTRRMLLQTAQDLATNSHFSQYSSLRQSKCIQDRLSHLPSLPRIQLDLLKADLKQWFDSPLNTLTETELYGEFLRRAGSEGPAYFSSLVQEKVFLKLPAWMRIQLADLWALSYLLAIQDFHQSNWLVYKFDQEGQGQVIAIDWNRASELALRGAVDFESENFLSQDGGVPQAFAQLVLAYLSPEMSDWIQNLVQQEVDTLRFNQNTKPLRGFPDPFPGLRARAKWLIRLSSSDKPN